MSLLIFQFLIVVFAFATIFEVVKLKQKGNLGSRGAFFWIFFWLGVCAVVVWPAGVQMLARTFGIGRGSDFVLYISVVTLFFLVFKLHIKIENMNRDVTKVVREKSLSKTHSKK
jgi:hypothetical protein